MRTLLAAWTARRKPPPPLTPGRIAQLTAAEAPHVRMRGPVDPQHDPCGRPPLTRGDTDD